MDQPETAERPESGAGAEQSKQPNPSDEAGEKLALKKLEVEQLRLETEINALRGGLHPWWRQGRSVTALVALIAAIVPITTGIQGLIERERERDVSHAAKVADARDKYLDIVLKEPKNAQLILRYLIAISDDDKIREWARTEQKYLNSATGGESRKKLYEEAVGVVAKLAHGDESQEARFLTLYEKDLLPVESTQVEALMVRARRVLDACKRPLRDCESLKELQNIAYQLARQTRDELVGDAIAQPPEASR